MAAREIRLDRGKLAKARKTPQGYVRVDGRLTRIGVLEYTRADGSIQRELRPAAEVFAAKSLETLDGVAVTDLHPSTMLDASNTQALARGHVRAIKQDGNFVAGELTVTSAELIERIDAGERCEISCGYTCEFDPTPGVWHGQRYDGVQRNIEYNHVAIGPRDWARCGNDAALRLDSNEQQTLVLVARFDADENQSDNRWDNPTTDSRDTQTMSLKINGVEIKLDAAEAKLVQDELDARAARADAAEQKAKKLEQDAAAAAGENAALKARCDAAEKRVAQVERSELEAAVKPVLGAEFKCDGKTDVELKAAVVAKVLPGLRLDGKDAAFVQGCYAAALEQAGVAAKSLENAARQSRERSDSLDQNDPDKARAEMIERNRAAASAK